MFRRIAILSLLSIALLYFVGCSGSSDNLSANTALAPQVVVKNMIAQWSKTKTGPVFAVDASGRATTLSTVATASHELGYITFNDLSGEEWHLQVDKVEYSGDTNAKVFTSYLYQNFVSGGLTVIFSMIKDGERWFIDNIEVIEMPVVINSDSGTITGYITDEVSKLAVAGALVEAYPENSQTIAGSAVTADDGYYKITNLTPGKYYLVINRDGYEPSTKSGIIVN